MESGGRRLNTHTSAAMCAQKGRRVAHWQSVALTWQKRGFDSFRAYQRSSSSRRPNSRICRAGIGTVGFALEGSAGVADVLPGSIQRLT
jgi:hypothetical protein